MSQLKGERKFMNDLNQKINLIIKKLDTIDENMNQLLNMQKNVNKNAEKMGEHIDFVENVYDNVKNPLGYICNKVSYLVGTDNYSLEDVNKKSVSVSESEGRMKEEVEEDKLTNTADYNSDFEEFETFSHFENDEVDTSIYN